MLWFSQFPLITDASSYYHSLTASNNQSISATIKSQKSDFLMRWSPQKRKLRNKTFLKTYCIKDVKDRSMNFVVMK